MTSTRKVFISVSGLLHRLSFPALLAEENLDFELLNSTRKVATPRPTPAGSRSVALYGDIDYDFNVGKKVDGIRMTAGLEDNHPERSRFVRLKYTREEIEAIKSMVASGGGAARLFTDTAATKSSFKGLNQGSYNIVHLATHGFYMSSINAARAQNILTNYDGLGGLPDNPMSRCGLLFAGANSPDGTINNGVLTALEISRLDLSKVDLAVLSACETGLGDIQGSEGVKGFQRAFAMAGVNSTLMSLWKVSDKHTSELMALFYKHLLSGQSKSGALKLAQREMRQKYGSPYYWAGFILVEG